MHVLLDGWKYIKTNELIKKGIDLQMNRMKIWMGNGTDRQIKHLNRWMWNNL